MGMLLLLEGTGGDGHATVAGGNRGGWACYCCWREQGGMGMLLLLEGTGGGGMGMLLLLEGTGRDGHATVAGVLHFNSLE